MKVATRKAVRRLLLLFVVLAAVFVYGWATMIRMPGESFEGELTPWTEQEKETAAQLREIVEVLAGEIGERHVWAPEKYHRAADDIEGQFASYGYQVRRDEFEAKGVPCYNLEVEIRGNKRPEEIIVVGAHYDTVRGSPGANDNASGIAGVLALASLLVDAEPERTLRFVAFANEEMPFFHTPEMGALRYAGKAREQNENIVGMISLETIGYFSDKAESQQYPFPLNLFYPSQGNFIGFVTHTGSDSRALLHEAMATFRSEVRFPSEGAALPERIPGVGWSDHWAFWQEGYPALMLTDTAPYRYPYYHLAGDTPDQLHYLHMARVVKGMELVIHSLAN